MTRNEIIDYIEGQYGVSAESPWIKFPNYVVFRHKNNSKWFALVMRVPSEKLDEGSGTDLVDIVNLKVSPELVGSLRLIKDVYPAYHMNKEHWVTIKLGGHFNTDDLKLMIDDSYRLTTK